MTQLIDLFEHCKTFGSLIRVPEELAEKLPAIAQRVADVLAYGGMLEQAAARALTPMVEQARVLAGRYDCVVTNPPYMGAKYCNALLKSFLKDRYKGLDKDLFSAFVTQNKRLTTPDGHLGFMMPFVWMFISSHETLRELVLNEAAITYLIQLEYSGFAEATVPICTFTRQNKALQDYTGSYIRLTTFRGAENQAPKTLEAIENHNCGWFYTARQSDFRSLPGQPIAYWISERMRDVFVKFPPLERITISEGQNKTGDNNRFVRFCWEVSCDSIGAGKHWLFYVKGGGFRRWAGNLDSVVDWSPEARAHYREDHVCRIIPEYLWDRKGITWGLITSSLPSFRVLPEEATFDVGGSSVFFKNDEDIGYVLAVLNSNVGLFLLQLMNPTLNFQIKNIRDIPLAMSRKDTRIRQNSDELCQLYQKDWNFSETAFAFERYILLSDELYECSVKEAYSRWSHYCSESVNAAKRLEEDNNAELIATYGLTGELSSEVPDSQITLARHDREEDIKRP